jgi:hypothetical protein
MLQQFSSATSATDAVEAQGGMDAMEAAAAKKRSEEAAQKRKFVPSSSMTPPSTAIASGTGEIDIDGDDIYAGAAQEVQAPKRRAVEADDYDTPSQRPVPAAVFGGLTTNE